MKRLLPFLLLCSLYAAAHPGTGIVRNSKGQIFYTDLHQILRLDPLTGIKTVVVPNVHSHELFMDKQDTLWGEHLWFADEASNRFDHYLWKLSPDGTLTKASPDGNAYGDFDFSLCRDNLGNQYRVQSLTTDHILKKDRTGISSTIASGNFKGVAWLTPFDDGSVYFTQHNRLFRIDARQQLSEIAKGLSVRTPAEAGIYQIFRKHDSSAVYVAVMTDQQIKQVNPDGTIEVVFTESDPQWSPTGGVFDADGVLWVLECAKNNEVRVIKAGKEPKAPSTANGWKQQLFSGTLYYWLIGFLLVITGLLIYWRRRSLK
jgi:hypothetical protein